MTSFGTTIASESSSTNVRIHHPIHDLYLTVFCPDRRPACPLPDTLGDHPKRRALLREHDSVRVRNLPSGDGTRHPSRRPRHARNRGTRPEGRRRSWKADQCVSRSLPVSNPLMPSAPQITKPSSPASKRSSKPTNKTSSSPHPSKTAPQLS